MAEDLGLKVAGLYADGSSFGGISEELEISKSSVGGLLRDGIDALRNNSVHAESEQANVADEQANAPGDDEFEIPVFDVKQEYDYDGILEKTFLVKAQPILRKVALNPRIFFDYDFAKKKFGWEGDIGDFLIECVEDFWKRKGYSIRIMYDEEMTW